VLKTIARERRVLRRREQAAKVLPFVRPGAGALPVQRDVDRVALEPRIDSVG